MAETRPNILWLCSDQQRYDTIHALNNPHIRTPHLDQLAAEGAAFRYAFAQSPICTPSRASFLTGRYPRTTRCRQNGQQIPAEERLVPRLLADAGYDCGLAGKLHLSGCHRRVEKRIDDGYRVFHWSHHPAPDWGEESAYTRWHRQKGVQWFDHYPRQPGKCAYAGMPSEYHQTTWCGEKAIEFLSEKRSGPWLMSVNFFDPHHAFDPPAEYLKRYDPDALPEPRYREGELEKKPKWQQIDHRGAYGGRGMAYEKLSPRERREVTAAYYAMIEQIDDTVGRVLQALDESNQRERTLVLFMSDHGECLGDHGIYLKGAHFYEECVRVPLIARWPGRIKKGLRSDALVELTDLAPTLMEVCGLAVPGRMQGKSLWPILSGRADPHQHREAVRSEYYNAMKVYGPRGAYSTMYRERRYKLVVHHGIEPGELYDLEKDPDEFENRWDAAAYREIKAALLKRAFDSSVFSTDPWPPRETIY